MVQKYSAKKKVMRVQCWWDCISAGDYGTCILCGHESIGSAEMPSTVSTSSFADCRKEDVMAQREMVHNQRWTGVRGPYIRVARSPHRTRPCPDTACLWAKMPEALVALPFTIDGLTTILAGLDCLLLRPSNIQVHGRVPHVQELRVRAKGKWEERGRNMGQTSKKKKLYLLQCRTKYGSKCPKDFVDKYIQILA